MDGRNIFKEAVRRLPQVAKEVLEKAALNVEDIDLFIPHQANQRINQAFAKALSIDNSKVYHNIRMYGNTTAASIPLAFDEALEKELVGRGSKVLFLGLGSGLTWGGVIYQFPHE
jgi:3-oxoacyl-[acyl-carrier-protein] synthase-3